MHLSAVVQCSLLLAQHAAIGLPADDGDLGNYYWQLPLTERRMEGANEG